MNAETRSLLSEHLFNQAEDQRLDDDEFDPEAMEEYVWGVFEDWGNGDWDAAEVKLLRLRA